MIQVDTHTPPPWVVHLQKSDQYETEPTTWPFATREEAVAAYRAAVATGEYTRVMRRATKKEPAFTVMLASVWRAQVIPDRFGHPTLCYVMEDVS